MACWKFFIDRGGTFTDVVALSPDRNVKTLKLPSRDPSKGDLAELEAIRRFLKLPQGLAIPKGYLEEVRVGTTVGTNALLERRGGSFVLLTTQGFKDAFRIGNQARPDLFARSIRQHEPLYDRVIEVKERLSAKGEVLVPLDLEAVRTLLQGLKDEGVGSIAVVFLHSWRNPLHEESVAALAKELGFGPVIASHKIAPIEKLILRGQTVCLEAYLSPILEEYGQTLKKGLKGAPFYWMQSSGTLVKPEAFLAKDSVLSGPAAGLIAAKELAEVLGFDKIITFDMGGTSSDISVIDGGLPRSLESTVGGVPLSIPMLQIHTIASGGGSILRFEADRLLVGPHSAGAYPGPACYGNQGPLTLTDANLLLGRLLPGFFPRTFGPHKDAPLDIEASRRLFRELTSEISQRFGVSPTLEEVAEGYLSLAAQNMANAISEVTLKKGKNPKDFVLFAFGSASGQLALKVAEILGVSRVLMSPLSGVLSALGVGLASVGVSLRKGVQENLTPSLWPKLEELFLQMIEEAEGRLKPKEGSKLKAERRVGVRYEGTDTVIDVDFEEPSKLIKNFLLQYRKVFGFVHENQPMIVDSLFLDLKQESGFQKEFLRRPLVSKESAPKPIGETAVFLEGSFKGVPIFDIDSLPQGFRIQGPAILLNPSQTLILEKGWEGKVDSLGNLLLSRSSSRESRIHPIKNDPFAIELFGNRLMHVAESMGAVLRSSASSVNIRERLDFSCALFDRSGDLLANAPHLPVHLGSMDRAVKALIQLKGGRFQEGEAFILNTPALGGTHLPDLTVVSPVFFKGHESPACFVASRGHHADVGGMSPGSMPAFSKTLQEEGVIFKGEPILKKGQFLEKEILGILLSPPFPARSPETNLIDIKAQLAANAKGMQEMLRLLEELSLPRFNRLVTGLRKRARDALLSSLPLLPKGRMKLDLDDGRVLSVRLEPQPEKGSIRVDFQGTSPRASGNWNAPLAVTRASILYAFRLFLDRPIPLNAGCLDPVMTIIPKGSFLDPKEDSAVAAGNVEISQIIVDALLGAMGVMAASQGTMNNISFGKGRFQYYETLGGGTGAGPGFHGASAVHSHMTNSRLTDPEVLESRFPVWVVETSIRPSSGGQGLFLGGDGMVRALRFLEPCKVSLITGRRRVAPHGLAGGSSGKPGENVLIKSFGNELELGSVTELDIEPGDTLRIQTPGGGGYGLAP